MRNLIIITMFFASACNTKLLVNKSKIVHDAKGYLLYYHSDRCLFIPSMDTSIKNFLNDTSVKKGYLMHSVCGVDGLKYVSQKFNVDMVYINSNQEVLLPDSIYLVTTRFRYLLNQTKSVDFNGTIEFKYQNKRYKIEASDSFYGEVLKLDGNAM